MSGLLKLLVLLVALTVASTALWVAIRDLRAIWRGNEARDEHTIAALRTAITQDAALFSRETSAGE